MGRTVAELEQDLDWDEFLEWIAFNQIEPFTEREFRADVRAGIVASTIANVSRGKDTKVFTIEDFMLFPAEKVGPRRKKPPGEWVDVGR